MASIVMKKPATMKMSPMPRPGPVPITDPTESAKRPPSASHGSNQRSASGPARMKDKGVAACAKILLIENVLPWMFSGTLVCHKT